MTGRMNDTRFNDLWKQGKNLWVERLSLEEQGDLLIESKRAREAEARLEKENEEFKYRLKGFMNPPVGDQ